MRNLKKILALVLALVMSLSLMATAGASKFPDVDAENPYATAIDVLDGLKVFQGFEDGTFKPTDTLNRAQAAVLVYRIATGDVENKYLDNYTFMQQSKFTDLEGYNWAKGYINYCQNAGIVVGTSATTFDPGAKVTGYQLLVMLLRTLGYGKAGEFADPKGWELQTAAIAEREGITRNVTAGDFGAPAPRQMVAEILFRGLLTETVTYSALVSGGYTKSSETLGMREFGLEEVTGVVMANEWASLTDDEVLSADTTEMLIDGKTVTLTSGTDLDAVGLTYNAYIAGKDSTKTALTLTENSINNVDFNKGEAKKVDKLASSKITADTEYYTDYDQGWIDDCTSDWVIRYMITESSIDAAYNGGKGVIDKDTYNAWLNYLQGKDKDYPELKTTVAKSTVKVYDEQTGKPVVDNNGNEKTTTCYTRTIRMGNKITPYDQAIMHEIFANANRVLKDDADVWYEGVIQGEVYAGTTSLEDKSDIMSWKAFSEEYFLGSKETYKFTECQNGESLRVIDNNGDGDAEYVLKVTYTMDQVIGTYKDLPELNTMRVAADYKDNNLHMPDELAVGEVVVYSIIDGKLSLWKAEAVTDTVTTKNFKDVTITTANSADPYGQSGISNKTGMDELIMNMDDKTEYVMYLDRFGYVRAYALAQGSQYALLTELYPTNSQNYNFVNNRRYIAEVQIGDAEVTEYNIANMSGKLYTGSIFNSESAWTQRINRYYNNEYNFLQPAIAHLGNPANTPGYRPGNTQGTTAVWKDVLWNRGVMQTMWNDGYLSVFTYGVDYSYTTDNGQTEWDVGRFSYTNIADYRLDGEDITLNSASQLQKDAKGEQVYYLKNYLGRSDYRYTRSTWVDSVFDKLPEAQQTSANETALGRYFDAQVDGTAYSYTGKAEDGNYTLNNPAGTINFYPVYKVDYVQLAAQDVKGGTIHYDIDKDYGTRYNTLGNGYVDATVDTEFYIVTPNGITYKTGYADLPTVKKGEIRAAYAVATNTQNAANGYDYWVADVIVIETNGLSGTWDSVSAMYYNPFEKTGSVRYINSLNAAWKTWQPDSDDLAMLDVVPGAVYNSEGDLNDNAGDWGNHPWKNEYGFYALYNTDLDDAGDLNAQRVVHIQEKWNDYGIYAGTVQRIRSLTGSGYIDVDKQGRPAGSLQVMTAADTLGFYFDGVPVYRVADKSATEIVLNQTSYSDVKIGDPIVWVYEKGSTSKVAFVIDLKDNTPKSEYVVPAWLQNDYDAIVRYQKNLGKGSLNVILGFDAAAGESMTVEPVVKTDAGNGVASVENNVASLAIPEKAARVQFVVKTSGIADLSKLVFTVDQANWRFEGVDVDGTDVTVEFIRVGNLTQSLAKVIEDVTGNNAVMTYSYFEANVLDGIDALVAAYNAETDADEKAELEEQIKATQNILDASTTENKTVADAIDTAMDTLTEAVDPTPAESFGALQLDTTAADIPAHITAENFAIHHAAGSQTASLNIKGDVPAAVQTSVADLVRYLKTSVETDGDVTLQSCTQKANGTEGTSTMYASAMDKIVVKVGTCEKLITINVTTETTAPTYRTVTWASTTPITVTVKDAKTQAGIQAGDVVTSGDTFLDDVVLEVAFDAVWYDDIITTNGTKGTAAGGKNTLTIGTGDATLTLDAKDTIILDIGANITLDSSVKTRTVEGVVYGLANADVKFTLDSGYKITTKTYNGGDATITDPDAQGVYTIDGSGLNVADKTLELKATAKTGEEKALEKAITIVNGLTLALEAKTAADADAVKAAVVAQVNAALHNAEITTLDIADTDVVVTASDGKTYAEPAQDGASVTAKVTITLDSGNSGGTALDPKSMTVTWKSDAYKVKAAVKAAVEAKEFGKSASPNDVKTALEEIINNVTVGNITVSLAEVTKPATLAPGELNEITYGFSYTVGDTTTAVADETADVWVGNV